MATSLKSNIYKSLEVHWLNVAANLKDKDSHSVSRFPDYCTPKSSFPLFTRIVFET